MFESRDGSDAYDNFASGYDAFTGETDYESWLVAGLLPKLEQLGLQKGRLLDVGCGTGRTFLPLLRQGWDVVGCDLSIGMLEVARDKVGDRVRLEVADARELPDFGQFELVWALNDLMNYLVEDGDLERALTGMVANLAPDGLVLFDANTIIQMEEMFALGKGMEKGGGHWEGLESHVAPGGVFEAKVWGDDMKPSIHHQRHWLGPEIEEAIQSSGLTLRAVFGQEDDGKGVVLAEPPNEQRDHKTIYIAALAR